MKMTLLLMLAVWMLVLPGCAATGAAPGFSQGDSSCEQVDCAKMAQISRSARRNGHVVIWVHPPQKTAAAKPLAMPAAALN